MTNPESFERISDKRIEKTSGLQISFEDQQYLCKSILETANNLQFESSPQVVRQMAKGIKLNELGVTAEGELYAPHTTLSIQATFSENADPTSVIKMTGRNAQTAIFSLNEIGIWELLRPEKSTEDEGNDDGYAKLPFMFDHAGMLNLIESRLKLGPNDNRPTGDDPFVSERYRALMQSMDRIPTGTTSQVKSLVHLLKPFSAAHDEILEYSSDFPDSQQSEYPVNKNGLMETQTMTYASLLRTMLQVKTNKEGVTCLLSIASPYLAKGSDVQKTYSYVLNRKRGNIVPDIAEGTVIVSGPEVSTSKEKLAEYAASDQHRNYPVESLLRGLQTLHDRHANDGFAA